MGGAAAGALVGGGIGCGVAAGASGSAESYEIGCPTGVVMGALIGAVNGYLLAPKPHRRRLLHRLRRLPAATTSSAAGPAEARAAWSAFQLQQVEHSAG